MRQPAVTAASVPERHRAVASHLGPAFHGRGRRGARHRTWIPDTGYRGRCGGSVHVARRRHHLRRDWPSTSSGRREHSRRLVRPRPRSFSAVRRGRVWPPTRRMPGDHYHRPVGLDTRCVAGGRRSVQFRCSSGGFESVPTKSVHGSIVVVVIRSVSSHGSAASRRKMSVSLLASAIKSTRSRPLSVPGVARRRVSGPLRQGRS